jgi:thiol:disulfide interchange protein
MPVKKTMKSKNKKKVLQVDSASKIPALEKILADGKITIVLVFADWCGACTRFRKDIWNPMCNGSATHNRVAVRDDMVRNTSLANAKFNYLPSLLVVNEKGEAEAFKTPEGVTNAMPTPRSLEDMNRIVNVPVSPLSEIVVAEEPAEMQMQ